MIVCIFVPALIIGLNLEPLDGDLTRIGYFSEKDYGWNQTSHKVIKKNIHEGKLEDTYDVIILGDSFTHVTSSWADIFSHISGLKVGRFHTDKYDVYSFVELLRSQNKLPKLFIYESVERYLKFRLEKHEICPAQVVKNININAMEYTKNTEVFSSIHNRDNSPGFYDLAYIIKYSFANFVKEHRKVNKYELTDSYRFSNNKSNEILLYSEDLNTIKWAPKDWEKIRCNGLHIQNLVQESESTSFVLLVAPDKTTVYKDFIKHEFIGESKLELLTAGNELNFLKIDGYLRQKVAEGEKDIYYPNNTHWSYQGHELVANKVLEYLEGKTIITK
jgi:hypothetical protein